MFVFRAKIIKKCKSLQTLLLSCYEKPNNTQSEIHIMSEIEYYNNPRKEIIQFLPKQYSKVLEIGCAEGMFRMNIKKDAEVWGVEPNQPSAQKAEPHYHKVLVGFFEQIVADLPENYFDLVICNDVIEHMPDPHQFFLLLKSKVTKECVIITSIPNVRFIGVMTEFLFLKDWRYRDNGVLDRTHLKFFTKKSLSRFFNECGLVEIKTKGLNSAFYKPDRLGSLIKAVLSFTFIVLSLGYFWDVQYVQYGSQLKFNR